MIKQPTTEILGKKKKRMPLLPSASEPTSGSLLSWSFFWLSTQLTITWKEQEEGSLEHKEEQPEVGERSRKRKLSHETNEEDDGVKRPHTANNDTKKGTALSSSFSF
jgi:hypothetical protein